MPTFVQDSDEEDDDLNVSLSDTPSAREVDEGQIASEAADERYSSNSPSDPPDTHLSSRGDRRTSNTYKEDAGRLWDIPPTQESPARADPADAPLTFHDAVEQQHTILAHASNMIRPPPLSLYAEIPDQTPTVMDSTSSYERRMNPAAGLSGSMAPTKTSPPSPLSISYESLPEMPNSTADEVFQDREWITEATPRQTSAEPIIAIEVATKKRSREETPASSAKASRKKRKGTAQQPPASSQDELSSDAIAAIGLPKEQYKPRPSRSRGAQSVVEMPIDVAQDQTPSKHVKAKVQKKRTVKDETSAKIAVAQHDDTADELDSITVIIGGSASIQKQGADAREDPPVLEDAESQKLPAVDGDDTFQGSLSKQAQNTQEEKKPRPKEAEQDTIDIAPSKAGKKRKRGRPRKSESAVTVREDSIEAKPELEPEPDPVPAVQDSRDLFVSHDNPVVKEEGLTTDSPNPLIERSCNTALHAVEPDNSSELSKISKKGMLSPASADGKVPFRVGLSRRNRVTSLLKIVRK